MTLKIFAILPSHPWFYIIVVFVFGASFDFDLETLFCLFTLLLNVIKNSEAIKAGVEC
jgi:hypothetical protein